MSASPAEAEAAGRRARYDAAMVERYGRDLVADRALAAVPDPEAAGGGCADVGWFCPPCPTCGWRSSAKTRAAADAGFARYSCARTELRAARAARVAERKAASGPVRDCQHPGAPHQHGTRAAYVVDECRCRRCRDANAATQAALVRRHLYGLPPRVDIAPVRAHVRALTAAGMTRAAIVRASGVSKSTFDRVTSCAPHVKSAKPITSCARDVARALLAIPLPDPDPPTPPRPAPAPPGTAPATPVAATRPRLDDHPRRWADALARGVPPDVVLRSIGPRRRSVLIRARRAGLRHLVDLLETTPGPDAVATREALARIRTRPTR